MTSPSIVRPAQRHRQSEPMPAPRRNAAPTGWRTGLASGSAIVGLLGGCSSASKPTATGSSPTTRPSPSPSASALDEQRGALAQYQRFWSSLSPISKMPAAQRLSKLAEVAVNPELKSLVAGMSKNDQEGQVFYGAQILHPKPIRVALDGTTAVVDDCQDSRRTGLATKARMAPVTVGVAHNHVVVTMKRSADDLWKVAFVSYTPTPC